jgi:hypothetical protein
MESPITGDIITAATINRHLLFDSNRRTLRCPNCLTIVTDASG